MNNKQNVQNSFQTLFHQIQKNSGSKTGVELDNTYYQFFCSFQGTTTTESVSLLSSPTSISSSPYIQYNKFMEATVESISKKLQENIGKYHIFESIDEKGVAKSIRKKLRRKLYLLESFINSIEEEPGITKLSKFISLPQRLNIKLKKKEIEFMVLVMYKVSKNIDRLPTNELLSLIKKPKSDSSSSDSIIEEKKFIDEIEEDYEEKKEEEFPDEVPEEKNIEIEPDYEEEPKDESKELVPKSDPQRYNESPSQPELSEITKKISEAEQLEITQKCFSWISEEMKKRKLTVRKMFESDIRQEIIEDEKEEVIPIDCFVNKIKELHIENIQGKELECLINVFITNEETKFLCLEELIHIMSEYGISESKTSRGLDLHNLDKVSHIIILALAEYLKKEGRTLSDFFRSSISKQVVKTKHNTKTIEVIDSSEFFRVLHEIGINTEDSEHENLKIFLAIGSSHPEKIYVKKLEKAVTLFSTDQELRKYAHDCYTELVGEEESPDKCENEAVEEKYEEEFEGDDNTNTLQIGNFI